MNGGLVLLGAGVFLGWLLFGRRSGPPASPVPWGAPTQSVGQSTKKAMAAIVVVALVLSVMASTVSGAAKSGKPPKTLTESAVKSAGLLEGLLAKAGAPKLPKFKINVPGKSKSKSSGKKVTGSARVLLKSKRLELTPNARADLKAGRVDRDLVVILAKLLRYHRLSVSVFKSGHSKHVSGTNRVSRHWSGRGVDIWKVDGGLVRFGHHPSRVVARRLAHISPYPAEVGAPFSRPERGFFTDRAHWDHLHIGVR